MTKKQAETKESIYSEVIQVYVKQMNSALENLCGHNSKIELMTRDFTWAEKELKKALLNLFFENDYGQVRIRRNTALAQKLEKYAVTLAEGLSLHFLTDEMSKSVVAEVLAKKSWVATIRRSYKEKLEEAIGEHFDRLIEERAQQEGAEIAEVIVQHVMLDMKMPSAEVVLSEIGKRKVKEKPQ